jgi:hypothetical protein
MVPHDSLEALRQAVSAEAGRRLPEWAANTLADGIIYRLMQHCWQQNSDVLGTERDVLAMLPGVPEQVLTTMLRHGIVQITHGEYIMPMAWREAPEHVRSRWREELTDEDRARMRDRAKLASSLIREQADPEPETPPEPEPEPEPAMDPLTDSGSETSLWGEELPEKKSKKKKKKPSKQPHQQRIIDHWFTKYEEHYEQKPPFTQRDAHHLKTALTAFGGDPAKLEDAIERYLQCKEPFFRGHPLSLFIGQLARWSDAGERRASTGSEHALDENIDTNIL